MSENTTRLMKQMEAPAKKWFPEWEPKVTQKWTPSGEAG